MRYFASAVLFMMAAVGLDAQTASQLDSTFYKARQEFDAKRQEFADSADAALADYLQFEEKLFKEYEAFRNEVRGLWGDAQVVESSRKEWVEYSEDKTSRTSVNWETGEAYVEVLVDSSEGADEVRQKLEAAVGALISSRGSTRGFGSNTLPDRPVSEKPVLEGMLDLSKYGVTQWPEVASTSTSAPKPFGERKSSSPAPGRTKSLNLSRNNKAEATVAPQSQQTSSSRAVDRYKAEEEARLKDLSEQMTQAPAAQEAQADAKTKEELPAVQEQPRKSVEEVAAAIVTSQEPEVQEVNTTEGEKEVVKITMELVEDHLPKRAQQFSAIVKKHTSTYSMDAPLIYAVMEQESAFNPMAQSWVPAYGLMQLVPKSGGRDAYRYVYKVDQIPSPDFLFDPDNNVQLGTGYLKLLMSSTFAKVKDVRCRMLCAIAAYNTGAGNVSRAINGTTNISKAIPTINSMTYDQLFEYLKANLPHAETKDYIQKVTSKMEKYIK
jgi:soluble lytic murein transglycosylase-like protein